MAKNNKEPWHKDNIEKTIESRKKDQRNLFSVIQAMDGQLLSEVALILKKHSGEDIANFSLLDSESKDYSKEAADQVRKKIDEVYSLDSKLHPLKGVIKKANLERNYFNNELVKGLYFKHIEGLKKGIGEKDYMRVMKGLHQGNLEQVEKDSGYHMFSDLDHKKHGDYIVEFLHDKYKFDKKKVSTDFMKSEAHNLMVDHFNKKLSKDSIHRKYKAHKKPVEV